MVSTYLEAGPKKPKVATGLQTITHQSGVAYEVSDLVQQATRFLILGTEGGTFYVNEKQHTYENSKAIAKALDKQGIELIDTIVAVSESGRAPKNEPALFALAMAASYQNANNPQYAERVRAYALSQLPRVARTGTHLFHFAAYADSMRGWGSGLRKAVGRWFTAKSDMALANQVTKYRQRDGWSMADLLRLSHPVPKNETQDAIFKYVVDGELPEKNTSRAVEYLSVIESLKSETDEQKIINAITDYKLPREAIPTTALNSTRVWEALLYAGDGMPMTAMIRNLGTMSKNGLLIQGSDAAKFVNRRLKDASVIKDSRVHPIDVLKAKLTYQSGRGIRSDASWSVVQSVVASLEDSFKLSFGNVEPTGKRLLLALDVSGSMGWNNVAGVEGLSPRLASAALALITANVEEEYEILAFSHTLIPLGITRHDSLNDALRKVSNLSFGGTNCALPMTYAMKTNKQFDAFIVYTDSETGGRNPSDALRQYRRQSGIKDAKLIVNAMEANRFSIADPTDKNMLDVVGFDTSAPQTMSMFIRGI